MELHIYEATNPHFQIILLDNTIAIQLRQVFIHKARQESIFGRNIMVPYELSGSLEQVQQGENIHAELLFDNKLFVFNDLRTRYKAHHISNLFLHVSLKSVLTHLCHFLVGVNEFISREVSKPTILFCIIFIFSKYFTYLSTKLSIRIMLTNSNHTFI